MLVGTQDRIGRNMIEDAEKRGAIKVGGARPLAGRRQAGRQAGRQDV